jgi:tRNA1(Val) A37 N6-methylase TrmN6
MADSTSDDLLLDGLVRLRQPVAGLRATIDPVLLAAAVPARPGETVLDIGTGTGAAALCVAARVQGCRVVGIDLERELIRVAAQNVALNGLGGRVDVMVGDLSHPPPRLAGGSFDHVMANPPHLRGDSYSPSRDPLRNAAMAEGEARLADWFAFALRMAGPRGTITLIHRPERLPEILSLLEGKAGGVVVFPLWPSYGQPAKRIIVQARKGSSAELRLDHGMELHELSGAYTEDAERVLRHGNALRL